MAISLSNLKPAKGSRSTSKRVGRGNSSGKGTTAGRGQKGQKARTGGRSGHKIRGARRLIMATPKLRGFKRQSPQAETVNVQELQSAFKAGEVVSPKSLKAKRLVAQNAKLVKVLGFGNLKKKLIIQGCLLSAAAKDKVLAAGGEVR
jgi:large subunit ribosomal protein L15